MFSFLLKFAVCRHLFRMQVFHFFGWLWIMNFIIALGQCVLAGAFASWYFAFHKPDVSKQDVLYLLKFYLLS